VNDNTTATKSIYELKQEQVEKQGDFMKQFDQFFNENDESPKQQNRRLDQSRSMTYQYNEEEDFFENLQMSGSFATSILQSSKNHSFLRASKTSQAINKQSGIAKLNLKLQKELSMLEKYENVFNLKAKNNSGSDFKLEFCDLTLKSMHERTFKSPSHLKKDNNGFVRANPNAS
jgi:hypothetical protein